MSTNTRRCHYSTLAAVRRNTSNRAVVTAITALFVFLTLSPSALAQVTGGTVSGTVTDPAQSPIPGAQVIISNVGKGENRTLMTDESGFYSAPNLTPGNYDVTVSANGFTSAIQKNVVMTVGQQLSINIQLKVGDVSEKVEIQAEAPGLATTSSTLSNVVEGRIVRELPLNGRDWTQLATLEPGVHTIEAQSQVAIGNALRANRGNGTQMTIGGNRPQQNVYRLDGIVINDYSGSGPGSVLGTVSGVDAIQEFSVITGNASADYGRTSGGVINAVTRSGQNQVHGSAYEFLRNSALDARNFFDGATVPPFKRNQFGASVGGPIYLPHFGEGGPSIGYKGTNRTFFFFDYEGLRQDLGSTTVNIVPSRAARAGQLAGGKVTVDPKIAPFLALFPLPNAGESGDIGFFSFASQAVTKVNFFTGRLDHKFSEADSLSVNALTDNSQTTGPDGSNFTLIGQTSKRKFVSLEETHIFNSDLLNVARVGFSRSLVNAPIDLGGIDPKATDTSIGFVPGKNVGVIQVTGLTSFNGGVGSEAESDYQYNSYQVYDDILYNRGAHSFKFGAAFERIQSNESNVSNPGGLFAFGSLSAFLTNRPQSFSASLAAANPKIYLRQSVIGAYAQDDFRVRSNFTLNLGVRYEMATVPTEKYGHLSTLANITDTTPKLGSPYFKNPTLLNFSPRVGFSWDPFKDGKTALRGGFGIYDSLPLTYQFTLLAISDAPFFQAGNVTTLSQGTFPTGAYPRLSSNDLRYTYVEQNPKRSYVEQWNLNVQRQLPSKVVLMVGYVGEHGVHQPFRTNDANVVLPTQTAQGLVWPLPRGSGTRVNPAVGTINAIAWLSSNTYHGMNVNVSRQQKGLRLGLSYTWSKSIDNSSSSVSGSNFNNSLIAPSLFFPQLMRGLSDFDVRHNLVVSYLWEIPHPKSAEGAFKWTTDGWQLGGIFRKASGLPFTPVIGGDALGLRSTNPLDWPDRVNTPDCKNPVNPGDPNHYIKTECFVVPQPNNRMGNSGRNIAIGPGLTNFDLSLFKNNHITERVNLQFRAEFFNVLNHANFSVPTRAQATLYNANFAPVSSAGVLSSTSTTSRQIQFALKLIF
jgi:hypothetical protein